MHRNGSVDGKAVVLSEGEIVSAVRSSMAIPSVFTAIEKDSTKLVDGGIIRNFPVTDIKEMGADIVIGVNLFKGLPDISKLNEHAGCVLPDHAVPRCRGPGEREKTLQPDYRTSRGEYTAPAALMLRKISWQIGKEIGKTLLSLF